MENVIAAKFMLDAQATWVELQDVMRALAPATLRGDRAATEDVRREAHAVLDRHLDVRVEGLMAIRRDLEPQHPKRSGREWPSSRGRPRGGHPAKE